MSNPQSKNNAHQRPIPVSIQFPTNKLASFRPAQEPQTRTSVKYERLNYHYLFPSTCLSLNDLTQDMAGLPFLSLFSSSLTAFVLLAFCANIPTTTVDKTITSKGIIITIRYNPVLLSLHKLPQWGFIPISMALHWQDQLCNEEVVVEVLTP